MSEHIGLPRNTISRLQTSPRKPQVSTVHTVADGLAKLGVEVDGQPITREIAERMAGLRAGTARRPGQVSAREAVLADPIYTEDQRQAMLQLLDIFEQANRQAD